MRPVRMNIITEYCSCNSGIWKCAANPISTSTPRMEQNELKGTHISSQIQMTMFSRSSNHFKTWWFTDLYLWSCWSRNRISGDHVSVSQDLWLFPQQDLKYTQVQRYLPAKHILRLEKESTTTIIFIYDGCLAGKDERIKQMCISRGDFVNFGILETRRQGNFIYKALFIHEPDSKCFT